MAPTLTRVTVSGVGKNAELLLPSDQPIATILPRLSEIVGDPRRGSDEATRTVLNRMGGPALSERSTLADENIADGAWLYLTSTQDALPEPIVFDVADVVEDELPPLDTENRWSAPGLVSAALGASCFVIALWLLSTWRPEFLGRGAAVLVVVCLLGAAALSRRFTVHSMALCTTALVATGLYAHSVRPDAPHVIILAAAVIGGVQLAREIHRRSYRGAVVLIATIVLVAVTWAGAWRLPVDHRTGAACVGVACAFLLGLAPRIAVALAGLNALDDARSNGATLRRDVVVTVLATAHRALASSLLWFAGSSVVAAAVVTRGVNATWRWDLPLIAAWGILLLLRSRHFPLGIERLPLALTGVVILTLVGAALADHLERSTIDGIVIALLVLAGLISLAGPHLRAPAHVTARGRLLADRIEAGVALLVVPLLVGHFGVYSALTQTFQK